MLHTDSTQRRASSPQHTRASNDSRTTPGYVAPVVTTVGFSFGLDAKRPHVDKAEPGYLTARSCGRSSAAGPFRERATLARSESARWIACSNAAAQIETVRSAGSAQRIANSASAKCPVGSGDRDPSDAPNARRLDCPRFAGNNPTARVVYRRVDLPVNREDELP